MRITSDTTAPTTLNPGDPGYDEAFHAAPHTGRNGETLRLQSPQDAQRAADEANNRAVAAAAKAEAAAAAKSQKPAAETSASTAAADKKAK